MNKSNDWNLLLDRELFSLTFQVKQRLPHYGATCLVVFVAKRLEQIQALDQWKQESIPDDFYVPTHFVFENLSNAVSYIEKLSAYRNPRRVPGGVERKAPIKGNVTWADYNFATRDDFDEDSVLTGYMGYAIHLCGEPDTDPDNPMMHYLGTHDLSVLDAIPISERPMIHAAPVAKVPLHHITFCDDNVYKDHQSALWRYVDSILGCSVGELGGQTAALPFVYRSMGYALATDIKRDGVDSAEQGQSSHIAISLHEGQVAPAAKHIKINDLTPDAF